MKFNLTKIELSKQDVKRNIKFPDKLNEELAELIGIMIEDGHLSIYKKGEPYNCTQSTVSKKSTTIGQYAKKS